MNIWQVHTKAWMTIRQHMEKEPDTKAYRLCASIYIMFKSKPNYPTVLEVRTMLICDRVLCLRQVNRQASLSNFPFLDLGGSYTPGVFKL